MINLKGRWRKPSTNKNNPFEKHNHKNKGGEKRRLLDMGRQKYFRFDLEDMLDDFKVVDNKNIITATLFNKMTTQSFDDAIGYIEGLLESGSINKDNAEKLKFLLKKYSKWR